MSKYAEEKAKEKIRFEIVQACTSTWKDTINGLSAKDSLERAINPAVRNINKIFETTIDEVIEDCAR